MQNILEILASILGERSDLLHLIFLIICIAVGIIALIKAGDCLSDAAANFATSLGLPKILVGLTVVSFATSAPELFTTISAARNNATGLIIGNIIGSNIANIGLILGISLLIKKIVIDEIVSSFQKITLLLVSFGFSGFLFFSPTQTISWKIGLLLVIFIFCYTCFVSYQALQDKNLVENKDRVDDTISESASNTSRSLLLLFFSALGLWIGSEIMVFGSKEIAVSIGIPNELIGFSVVAVGTSLPELAASIALLKNSQTAMLLGNIIGSNLFNIGLVGGVAGILTPVRSGMMNPWIDHLAMLILTVIFCIICTKKVAGRTHGIILLIGYIIATCTTWWINA